MTARLQPYPEYKHSGLPWLGRVPAHWDVRPAFTCYAPRQVQNTGMVETKVLSLSYGRIVVKPPEKLHGLVPASFETYQIADDGAIIIRPTDLQNDHNSLRVGYVRERGIITSAYICLRTKGPITSEYGYWFLFVWDITKAIYGYGSGLRQNLDFAHFRQMPVAVPPPDEQDAIVRFLRSLDSKVNHFIRNRRRLIEVLNEQKQAIINRAVTHGLDPNVKLKPSGVEWLGEIPAHWEVLPLKRIAWFKSGSGFPVTSQGQSNLEIPFFRVSDMTIQGNDVFMANETSSVTREEAAKLGATVFPRGAIIFPKVGGALLTNKRRILTRPSCVDNNIMGCVVRVENADFIFLLLRLIDLGKVCKPGPVPAIGEGDVREIRVPWPPLAEQERIVSHEEQGSLRLNAAVARAQREIDLIREYRTRLIADVVTGKVDVRHLAPTEPLPAESEAGVDIEDKTTPEDTETEPGEEAIDADN